jgi:hypothetical protein
MPEQYVAYRLASGVSSKAANWGQFKSGQRISLNLGFILTFLVVLKQRKRDLEQQVKEIQQRRQLGDAARLRGWRYALTMFSGASKIESFVRYNFTSFYYSGSADKVTSELKLKPTPSGANVWIFTPRDEGAYWGTQQAGNLAVVSKRTTLSRLDPF